MAEINFLEPQAADAVVAEHELAPHGELCPSCGCPVESTDKFCPACGKSRVVEASVVPEPDTPAQKHLRCSSCGSEMTADLDQRSYVCPFCDSTYVVEFSPADSNRQRPEFVIGFAVTREQALEKFRQWIRSNSWFRPGDLATKAAADKQKGVYLPFWSFSMLAQSTWSSTIGEYWYRTETYTVRDSKGKMVTRTRQVQETEWWPLSGRHHRYYSGYLVSGSRGLPQSEAYRIMPFNLPALKRYEPYFLAGWLCEEYSVEREDAKQASLQEFQRREQQNITAFLPGNTHRDLHIDTQFSRISSDLCLLPVYVLSYRYQNKLYRFLVNGQTGKVDGDKPLSSGRILAAVGIVALVIAIIALIVFLMNR